MGVKLDRFLFMGMISVNKGTIRIETIRYSFQQLQQPPKIKVKRTINCISIVTQHSQIVFFLNCIILYKYIPLISFPFVSIYQGEVPQYGISLPCGPIHTGKFFIFLTSLNMGLF